MLNSTTLKQIATEARVIIERQLDDADLIKGLREVVTAEGGDWSALKALLKAQIQDERDDSGEGKHVQKIIDKAEFSSAYAGMLGLNMNEQKYSSDDEDVTIIDRQDTDGNHLRVTVDPRIAAILNRSDAA